MTINRPQVLDQTEAITVLPEFMKSISEWQKGISGDWCSDNDLGRHRANSLAANIKMTGNYPALARFMKLLADEKQFGPVEIGFFQRIAELVAR